MDQRGITLPILISLIVLIIFGVVGILMVFSKENRTKLAETLNQEATVNIENAKKEAFPFIPEYHLPGEAKIQEVSKIEEFIADIPCEDILGVNTAIQAEMVFDDYATGKIRALYCVDSREFPTTDTTAVNISTSRTIGDYDIKIDSNQDGEPDKTIQPSALLKMDVSNEEMLQYYLKQNPHVIREK